ncbi:MAG TPA: Mu transposase C-terminal domain-containing protein [Tepidisphaeraceae bacterium]
MPNSHGGKPRWEVRQDADDRLASIQWPEQKPCNTRDLSAAQCEELEFLHKLVTDWERAPLKFGPTIEKAIENYLKKIRDEHGRTVHPRTLRRLCDDYRRDGLDGLKDGRWRIDRKKNQSDDPFRQTLGEIYLKKAKPKITKVLAEATAIAKLNGWTRLPYHTARRYLLDLPRDLVLKMREGKDAYTRQGETYIERDYSKLASNEQWCGDHHQFDVVVKHHGKLLRPWLTAWMDMRSRKIVGWCICAHDPNTGSILSALRNGCESHGVPSTFYIDNGKDYDSYTLNGRTKWERRRGKVCLDTQRLAGIFHQLGCTVNHCWAYHGQSKPIERFFGTMEERFGKDFETYCGRSTSEKPDDLQRNLDAGRAMELVDFIASFEQWLDADYHNRIHTGDAMEGRTPERVYAESWNGTGKRTASADLLDLLLMRQSKPVKVTRNGVTWNHLRYGQHDAQLRRMLGKEVYLRIDESNVGRVFVWTLEGRFICEATANIRVAANAPHQELAAAIALKRKTNRIDAERRRSGLRINPDMGEVMEVVRRQNLEAAAASSPPPNPDGGPASIKMIRSPMEADMDNFRAARDRQPLRKAVGGEGIDIFAIAETWDMPTQAAAPEIDYLGLRGGEE